MAEDGVRPSIPAFSIATRSSLPHVRNSTSVPKKTAELPARPVLTQWQKVECKNLSFFRCLCCVQVFFQRFFRHQSCVSDLINFSIVNCTSKRFLRERVNGIIGKLVRVSRSSGIRYSVIITYLSKPKIVRFTLRF